MTDYKEELLDANRKLGDYLDGFRIFERHLIPDYVLHAYALDVLEHTTLIACVEEERFGRALISNARAAFESALDMKLLVAEPEKYDRNGALARTAELVELEQLEVRRDAAVEKLGLGDVPNLRSPEEVVVRDAELWESGFSDAGSVLRETLEIVRREGRGRGHWSGLSRKGIALALDKAYSSQEPGLAEMIDSTYGLLSMHAHPRPRVGSRREEFIGGELVFSPRTKDLRLARSIAYLSAEFAHRAVLQRESWAAEVPKTEPD